MSGRLTLTLFFLTLLLHPGLANAQGTELNAESVTAEGAEDSPGRRELWFRNGRTTPNRGAAAARFRARAHHDKVLKRLRRAAHLNQANAASSVLQAGTAWNSIGPAPQFANVGSLQDYGATSGRANAIAIDPADLTGNTVYVGGAYGGLWRSQNAASGSFGDTSGVSWLPLTDDQPTLSVGAIALQPGNINPTTKLSNLILLGTGEGNAAIDSYYGLGFLRSIDAGATWNLISTAAGGLSLEGLSVTRMAFSQSAGQTNRVVAAISGSAIGTEDGLATPTSTPGLYTSTDAGLTWSHQAPTDAGSVIDSTSATSVVFHAASSRFYAAIRYHGFYSSTDGVNWARLPNQPGGAALSNSACPSAHSVNCPIFRGEVASLSDLKVSPPRNELYVWYVDGNFADRGIYRSTDGGNKWDKIAENGLTDCGDVSGCGTQQSFFNLQLAAVTSATSDPHTDLYAGAVNEYKCTLNDSSVTTCSQGSWLNLTHVYGCPSIAHVHPDQHAIDHTISSLTGKEILYFANDGGVYRALDGQRGLTSGSCSGANQFDSLNASLGSMTQFVSFSQSPVASTTLLGGTQDNGSPATSQAGIDTTWTTVNTGDGGYSEINPSNANDWFTENTGVSIQRCTVGINCDAVGFNQVVSSSTVAGDVGAFYTPYSLDPQSSNTMLVGTCRIWRGHTDGSGFVDISNNFDTQTPTTCTGPSSTNVSHSIRALAAGGPKDASGLSKVIYATTEGSGPLGLESPPGGRVLVTTNASAGTLSWKDVTQSINPNQYTISSVAVDSTDPTGQTAYVSIMGFNTASPAYSSHVFKTTDAGGSWQDFTGAGAGALPDAPANTLAIDTSASMLYVGTDVGVFSSTTASANWSELGPAATPNASGFLPNVPVTKVRIFRGNGQVLLRAATYGRGMWEFPLVTTPDYLIGIANPSQTIFPGQTATFPGTLRSLSGYNSRVAFSCAAAATLPPQTCNISPVSLQPASGTGSSFSLTARDSIGDYVFNVHGIGSDPNSTTHDQSVTVRVVDFSLSLPSPTALSVNRPGDSNSTSVQVSAFGSFNLPVNLACSGLPAGAMCRFVPGSTISPVAGSPVPVTLSISASGTTPAGNSVVTITGTSGSVSRNQNVSLTVTTLADYTLSILNSPQSALVNGNAIFNGTLTSVNGYNNQINLSCGPGSPPVCNIDQSASIVPSGRGAPFTITASSSTSQTYLFNVIANGTDALHIAHSSPITFNALPDFTLDAASTSATVGAGSIAQYSLNFRPGGGDSIFQNDVTYSCVAGTLPGFASCNFTPSRITAGSAATSVSLSITTRAPSSAAATGNRLDIFYFGFLQLAGVLGVFVNFEKPRGDRKKRMVCCAGLIILCFAAILSCGGGGSGSGSPPPTLPTAGTPSGTFSVTINASEISGNSTVQHTTTVSLTVQ